MTDDFLFNFCKGKTQMQTRKSFPLSILAATLLATVPAVSMAAEDPKDVVGGYEEFASNNKFTVADSIVGSITGGYGGWDENKAWDANKNAVTITNSTVNKEIIGGYSRYGYANENKINFNNGQFSGDIKGGGAYEKDAASNQVTLNNANFLGGEAP